ncbi:SET domain-containing protein [Pilatotrama ljubarskyi]|nr:SET domain-containing protein [Pilatotrama ljubarskyi]
MQTIPGKGKGLVAVRAIACGELLLEEAPLFTQQHHINEESLAAGLSRLSRDDQLRYLSLANSWKGIHRPLSGIWLTNAIPCGTPEDPSGDENEVEGIFPIAARLNASCRPNVHHWWDFVRQRLILRAERDIAAGEELTTAYTDILESRDERRAQLQEHYNFDCCCVACSLTSRELRKSDLRATVAARLYDQIAQCGGVPVVGIRKVREKQAPKLLEEEGLLGVRSPSFYCDAFQFCVYTSLWLNAKAWARKAWEWLSAVRGPDSADAKTMERYAKNPHAAHGAFGMLGRKTLVGPDQ